MFFEAIISARFQIPFTALDRGDYFLTDSGYIGAITGISEQETVVCAIRLLNRSGTLGNRIILSGSKEQLKDFHVYPLFGTEPQKIFFDGVKYKKETLN